MCTIQAIAAGSLRGRPLVSGTQALKVGGCPRASAPLHRAHSGPGQTKGDWPMVAYVPTCSRQIDRILKGARSAPKAREYAGAAHTAVMEKRGTKEPVTGFIDSAAILARRLESSRGQTTTEWIMIAGIVTTTAIFLGRVMPAALKTFICGDKRGSQVARAVTRRPQEGRARTGANRVSDDRRPADGHHHLDHTDHRAVVVVGRGVVGAYIAVNLTSNTKEPSR